MVCLGNKQRPFCRFWDCTQVLHFRLKYCISDPSTAFDYEGYSIFSKGFLPTVVDIMVIWVKFTHSSPFQFADSSNVDIHSCHLLFEHFQLALIHGPDIPGSYAILLFTASDLASITSQIHSWVFFLLWLHPFILSGVISPLISSSILGTLNSKYIVYPRWYPILKSATSTLLS